LCGIVGYAGFRDAKKVILDGLKRLEYRGYDSAGVAVIGDSLQVFKQVGYISDLVKNIPDFKGHVALGHTRWATHGAVNKKNAHPHIDCNKKIAIVHNGIIENFKSLQEKLEKNGHKFSSNTDSEILVHLIEEKFKEKNCLEDAIFSALKDVQGSYAIVVVSFDDKEKIVAARKDSPLVVGVGDNENFVASDVPALLKYTNRVIYLDDGELCVLDKDSVNVFDQENKKIDKDVETVSWDVEDAEKSGFSHFMLKEIYDQPGTINQVLRGRVSEIKREIFFPDKVEGLLEDNNFDSIDIVACGTSYYAGLVGKYFIEKMTNIPVSVSYASEFRYYGIKKENSLVIGITQSGETADTLAGLREAKKAGCKTLVVSNVIGSTATRISDGYILTQCGPEIGVAATKTFTAQMVVLFLLGLKIGFNKGVVDSDNLYHYIRSVKEIPMYVRRVLENVDEIKKIAGFLKDKKSVFYIGRGVCFPLALEGALKLKEISYLHAEGFAAGELKHGPFALLTEKTPVIAVLDQDKTYDKMLSNIGEVKARGSPVIAISKKEDSEIEKHADMVLRYHSNNGMCSCVSIAVILQLLSYYVASLCDCSIDKPRNLAKSVTVE